MEFWQIHLKEEIQIKNDQPCMENSYNNSLTLFLDLIEVSGSKIDFVLSRNFV